MRRPHFLFCLLATLVTLQAADIPLDDTTIVVGERIGPIKKGMTLAALKALFGPKKVSSSKLPGPEGTELDGVKLFAETDRELEIFFDEDSPKKEIMDVSILGKGWKFENGLKLGQSISDVEKVNGKPYQVAGFDWDYGGYANFEGGKLDSKVSVRFSPTVEADPSLSGDKLIPSTDLKLRASKAEVTEISVYLR